MSSADSFNLIPLAFMPGPYELLIIGFVALLLFGKRLPTVARSMGQSLTEFKKGMSGIEDEIRNAGDKQP